MTLRRFKAVDRICSNYKTGAKFPPAIPYIVSARCCVASLRYEKFFAGRLNGKKKSLLVTGDSDTGKSYFSSLVRYQFPTARIFTPLNNSEFFWADLDEKMHFLGYCNDFRFSEKVPAPQLLNWLEGLTFKYNRKHQAAGESTGPLCMFTSNDVKTGWKEIDIKAFFARIDTKIECAAKFEDAGIQENEGNSRVQRCPKCGACGLLALSNVLQQLVKNRDPLASSYYELHLKNHFARKEPDNREYQAMVDEAERR